MFYRDWNEMCIILARIPIKWCVLSISYQGVYDVDCLIAGYASSSLVSAGFLYCKVTIFFSLQLMFLGEITVKLCKSCLFPNFCPLILTFFNCSEL